VTQVARTGSQVETRSKIIDVAARLLHEHGPAAVTTRGVAHGAGVQAPTIYRLFGDKDGLLEAVAEHVMRSFVSAKAIVVAEAAADGIDPLEDLRAGWQTQIAFGLSNPVLFQLLSDPTRVNNSPAAQSGRKILEARVHRVAVAGKLRVSEQRAVGLIQAAGIGAIQTILSTAFEHRDSGLADALYEAVLDQILIETPERASVGLLATTVTFRAIAPDLEMYSNAERQVLIEWLDRAIATL
jgi:AcrR family transcriptional regulator